MEPPKRSSSPDGNQPRDPLEVDPDRWVDHHGDAMFRYALARVRDRQVAEDLVQEALLGALQSRERFRGQSAEQTWLIGILKHKILDHYRRAARAQKRHESGPEQEGIDAFFDQKDKWTESPGDWPHGPLSPDERAELRGVIEHCASKLPDTLAAIFTLRELEKMDGPDICKALDLTPTNLWTRVHRMRMMLRVCLETHWLGESSDQPPERKRP